VQHSMSPRQVQFMLSVGLINWIKERLAPQQKTLDMKFFKITQGVHNNANL